MAGKQLAATGRRFALALRRQRKVLLLFLLTILLPAAVLSVFGLRALEADRYRIERLMRREQEEAFRGIRGRLTARFDAIAVALAELGAKGARRRIELRHKILRAISNGDLPQTVVSVSDSGEFFYVREGFVSLPFLDRPDAAAESAELLEAQRLEHTRKDAREAAFGYARLAKSEMPEVRQAALNGLGRISIKLGELEKAIAAYREVLRQQPEILTTATAVLPLMAGLQIAFCYEKLGQARRALPDLVAAYGELVERRWIVASETVAFYSSEYENVISAQCSKNPTDLLCVEFRRLSATKSARLAKVRELESLQRDLPPLLFSSRPASDMTSPTLRLPVSTAVVARLPEGSALAAVISDSALLALVTRDRTNPANNDAVRVLVQTRRGEVLFRNGTATPGDVFLEERLGEGLPDWKIVFFHDPADVTRLADFRKSIYGILTVTLIFALLLGAFMMARTVHHEMELIRIKSDFVSLVSHEFKTPIASMRALVERLQAGHVPQRERMQHYFDIVSGELQRLTRLVNNVLDFSKIEEGRKVYSPQETDLGALVSEVVATFEAGASAKGFAIETAIGANLPKVSVDRDGIAQALLNLLDNAVKYSRDEKQLRVGLDRNSHFLRITVADRGAGIEPKEVTKVFEKFYRSADATDRGIPGLGLGLSLVRHVMESHGGTVAVETLPGSGSTFTLSIPLDEAATAISGREP